MRKHGFERPFHPLQITSWIVFTTDAAVFSVIGLPLIKGETIVQAIVGVFFFTSIIALIYAWLKATRCDPSDPHLRRKADSFTQEEYDELPFCEDCNCPVFPRSKHCRACDKCVHVFDHHCKWLNNCVGQDNYRHFALAVSSVAVMTGIVLVCSLTIVVEYAMNEDAVEKRLREVYGETPKELVVAALSTLVVVNAPLCLLDLQLVLFHVFLSTQHLTTFEYIKNKRELEIEDEDNGNSAKKRGRALPKCIDWIVYKSKRKPKAETPPVDQPAPNIHEVPPNQIGTQEYSSGGKSLNDLIALEGHATAGGFPEGGEASISGVVLGAPPTDPPKLTCCPDSVEPGIDWEEKKGNVPPTLAEKPEHHAPQPAGRHSHFTYLNMMSDPKLRDTKKK